MGLPTSIGIVETRYFPEINKTLATAMTIPFFCRTKYWNAKLYDGKQVPSKKMYEDLMKKGNWKEGGKWHQIKFGNGLILNGFMSNGGKVWLLIHLFQDK